MSHKTSVHMTHPVISFFYVDLILWPYDSLRYKLFSHQWTHLKINKAV